MPLGQRDLWLVSPVTILLENAFVLPERGNTACHPPADETARRKRWLKTQCARAVLWPWPGLAALIGAMWVAFAE